MPHFAAMSVGRSRAASAAMMAASRSGLRRLDRARRGIAGSSPSASAGCELCRHLAEPWTLWPVGRRTADRGDDRVHRGLGPHCDEEEEIVRHDEPSYADAFALGSRGAIARAAPSISPATLAIAPQAFFASR